MHSLFMIILQRVFSLTLLVILLGTNNQSIWLPIVAPGQNGDPKKPHYDDLLERWQRVEYLSMR